jgi:hypothetical protein
LQVQDALANASKKSNDSSSNAGSPAVVPSDPAILPAPAEQQISLTSSEVKAPAEQQIPPVPEIKQAGKLILLFIYFGFKFAVTI